MRKNIIYSLFCFILLQSSITLSQTLELGKVTLDELKSTNSKSDSKVLAEYIFMTGTTEIKATHYFQCTTTIEAKLKIYNKEGLKFFNEGVEFYLSSLGFDKANFDKINLYTIENGKVKKSRLKSVENKIDYNNCRKIQVKPIVEDIPSGSIIEYRIIIENEEPTVLPAWYFQMEVPVQYSKYVTSIPSFLHFEPKIFGFFNPEIANKIEKRSYNYGNTVKSFLQNIISYELKNVPATFNEEPQARSANDFRSKITNELVYMETPKGIKEIPNNWEDLSKLLNKVVDERYSTVNFDDKNKLKNSISNDFSEEQKIEAIFNYVQSYFTHKLCYDEFDVKKIYESHNGSAIDINLILTCLLRKHGVNASPLFLSTRDYGFEVSPSFSSINYAVTAIEDNGKFRLLDASDKNTKMNIIREIALNNSGRLIRKDNTSMDVDLTPNFLSSKSINIIGEIMKDGSYIGNVREYFSDYYALQKRSRLDSIGVEKYKLINGDNEKVSGITNFEILKPTDSKLSFIQTYNFSSPSNIENEKIKLNPLLFFKITENTFAEQKRLFPIDFIFPSLNRFLISIKIPEGYLVENLPSTMNLNLPNDLGEFQVKSTIIDDNIQLLYILKINTSVIDVTLYKEVQKFFQSIADLQQEKIILRKK